MADKGERTRQRIIEETLPLFSVKGYFNTSISDILAATRSGLQMTRRMSGSHRPQ